MNNRLFIKRNETDTCSKTEATLYTFYAKGRQPLQLLQTPRISRFAAVQGVAIGDHGNEA